jgi:hypothetical protein
LVLLEDHSVLDDLLLVEVVPGSVGALLSVTPILKNPVTVLVLDSRLHLGNELVINADIAVRRSSND